MLVQFCERNSVRSGVDCDCAEPPADKGNGDFKRFLRFHTTNVEDEGCLPSLDGVTFRKGALYR